MQDIDFDEIDRAVSSVTNPGREPSAPVNDVPASNPAISSHGTPSLAARRSSGRFMDVVHPSSDMRPHAPAAATFRREEVNVPTERTEVPARPEVAPVVPSVEAFAPAPVIEPVVEQAPARSAFHWPDPIDMADTTPVAPVVTTPEPVVEPVAVPSPVVSAPIVEDVPAVSAEDAFATSLESPFLTNAKVEKRPLGAFSFNESDLPLIDDFPHQPGAATDAVPTVAGTTVEDATELDEEILLLEADNEEPDAPEEPNLTSDVSVESVDTAVVPVETETALPTPSPTPVDDAPVGPTSITQQYKEHPSTDAQTSGAIYDTATYHQPLAHPAKKGSSFLIVVWILALILVGAGIGAAVYFFVIPLL